MTSKRKPVRKLFSEMTASERVAEAHRAIARIRESMMGDNRFGSYGQSCRESIARWQAVIDREG